MTHAPRLAVRPLPLLLALTMALAGLAITASPAATAPAPAPAAAALVDAGPGGIVADQYGRPRPGLSVTLLRSDTSTGTFAVVPNGSPVMSPANTKNPSITESSGSFRWDVIDGWYKLRTREGICTETTTPAMQVPPKRLDLLVKATCSHAAPKPTTVPVITGTPQVGKVITAQAATWPAPLANQSLELLRNGTPLPGTTHTLAAADVGAVFTARSIGRRPTYTPENGTGTPVTFTAVTAISAPVTGVAATPDPQVTGTATAPVGSGKVGTLLAAATPAWNTNGVTTTRVWTRDGVAIPSATGTTYEVVAADVGKAIRVVYTGTKTGWVTGVVTSPAVTGQLGDAPIGTVAKPAGTGKVGTTLTAATPTWNATGISTSVQWLRNGVAISGATGPTYVVQAADVGATIAVRYTGTKAGYQPGVVTSPGVVGLAGDAPHALTLPAITGTPRVGSTLTAGPGTWDAPNLQFAYQWQVLGADLPGATASTYVVPAALAGYPVTVKVTASRPGTAAGTANSAPVRIEKLASSIDAFLERNRIKPGARGAVIVDVDVPGTPGPTGVLSIYEGPRLLVQKQLWADDLGTRTLRLPRLGVGNHRLVAFYSNSVSATGSSSRPVILRVRR